MQNPPTVLSDMLINPAHSLYIKVVKEKRMSWEGHHRADMGRDEVRVTERVIG